MKKGNRNAHQTFIIHRNILGPTLSNRTPIKESSLFKSEMI